MATSSSDKNGTTGQQVHTLPLIKDGLVGEIARAQVHGSHDGHGHGAGRDHVPHVLPLSTYFLTWISLLILTALTVGASYVNFGSANILIALLIATIKATIVALMFMHLRWDHKFHSIIFSFSLIFLGIFIAFTMYDTETRGRTDMVQKDRSANVRAPFKGATLDDKQTIKLKQDYGVPTDKPLPAANLTPPN